MTRYVVRRLLVAVVLLLVVSLLTFVVFYLLPTADPARLHAGPKATPAVVESIRHQLGLDRSWAVQYGTFLRDLVFHLDLGHSYQSDVAVRSEILSRLPATISLALGALVIWMTAGIAVGVVSATRPGSLLDRLAMGGALVAISAPVYWLGLVCIYLFDKDIGAFPILPGQGAYVPLTDDPARWFQSLIMPWCVLAAGFAAVYARLLRSTLIETMSQDYIRTARAKGLRRRRVVLRHGLRSAITPLVSAAGVDLGVVLGGAILTESIFNIPGIGQLAYESIRTADLPMIQGTVLFGALFVVVANLVVDVLYTLLDPRIRY
ncbi:MAG: peptide/nickel transport system permease protein [Solirubrobacteraceae bacterium]|jgi:peptide/nickel transport system permease protein|nr:peptide/nickel transport system permease protein [Solirubrobacteraceae bacterium]